MQSLGLDDPGCWATYVWGKVPECLGLEEGRELALVTFWVGRERVWSTGAVLLQS